MRIDRTHARGFAAVADAYERARPSWPLEAIDAAFAYWRFGPDAGLVVDVAAGTGRLTRVLAQRCPQLLAVEPLPEMRAHIDAAPAIEGSAEQLGLEDSSAQAIFVAEAFHWFDRPAALAEFARVLVAGGGMAVMWNTPPRSRPARWQEALGRLFADVPQATQGRKPPGLISTDLNYRDPTDPEWRSGPEWEPFEPIAHRDFHHVQTLDRAGIVDLISSWSFVGALDQPDRSDLLDEVARTLIEEGIETAQLSWRTDLYMTRRR